MTSSYLINLLSDAYPNPTVTQCAAGVGRRKKDPQQAAAEKEDKDLQRAMKAKEKAEAKAAAKAAKEADKLERKRQR